MKHQKNKNSQQKKQPSQQRSEKDKNHTVDTPVPIASIDQLNFPSI